MEQENLQERLRDLARQLQEAGARSEFARVKQLAEEITQLQGQAIKQVMQAFTPVKSATPAPSAPPDTNDMLKDFQQVIGGKSMQELVREGQAIQEQAAKLGVMPTQAVPPKHPMQGGGGVPLPQTGVTPSVGFAPLGGGLKIIDNKFVEFGSFPQGKNGEVEKILWRVLENKNGQMLLVSEHVLACKRWNDTMIKGAISWEVSDLRKWLNEYFFNTAFNSQEKSQIIERLNTKNGIFYHKDYLNKVKNEYAKHNVLHDDTFEKYHEQGGDTRDKVFLLNVEEVLDFFKEKSFIVPQTVWIANKERSATATDYAIKSSTFVQNGTTHVALLPFDGETWSGKQKIKVAPEFIGCVDYWLRNAGITLPSGYS
ncbi:MAG: DUF6273 domain-containing protein, partial [Bacteroidales bacterium]|nr:DUF6273 domain-containing protein [Bacteroidales bacterium]